MRNKFVGKDGLTIYELGFLILPSIPEDKLGEVTASIRAVISKSGGIELDAEEPVKQSLAYSMSKNIGTIRYVLSDAYIGWIKFEADASKIATIQAGAEKITEILRFLLVKAPRETTFTFAKARAVIEASEEPKPMPTGEVVVE